VAEEKTETRVDEWMRDAAHEIYIRMLGVTLAAKQCEEYLAGVIAKHYEKWQSSHAVSASPDDDVFDLVGKKLAREIVEVCKISDRLLGEARTGAITALEELYFRLTNGKHLDWEENRGQFITKQPAPPAASVPEGRTEKE